MFEILKLQISKLRKSKISSIQNFNSTEASKHQIFRSSKITNFYSFKLKKSWKIPKRNLKILKFYSKVSVSKLYVDWQILSINVIIVDFPQIQFDDSLWERERERERKNERSRDVRFRVSYGSTALKRSQVTIRLLEIEVVFEIDRIQTHERIVNRSTDPYSKTNWATCLF